MAAALAWESTQWRGAPNPTYYQHHQATMPKLSGHRNSLAAHASMNSNSRNNSYVSKSPADDDSSYAHRLPSLTDPCTDASTYHTRLHERPTPPSDALMNGPPHPPAHHQARGVSSWPNPQRHSSGTVGNERHAAGTAAPLTLQIPKDQELPRISTMFNTPPSGHYHHDHKSNLPSPSQSSTMLPPFASFQDHAKRADGFNDAQRTSSSAHPPCHLCSKLQPMVAEVATAVAELDESIQFLSNKPWSRSSEYPKENLLHAVQWILDRLRCGKVDMQATIRTVRPGSGSQPTPTSGMPSRNISPSMPLKRPAELWDREDSPAHKRQNTGRPFEEPYRTPSLPTNDRTASHPYHSQGHMRPAHITPPPMDAAPGSAWSKMPSPGHAMRSLPSPSSIAYPPSTAASVAPQHTHSPTMSHTAEALHSGSSDAATSAHIADLQHQVTLKTLALQTLQSEYSSLLQRVQRLNVKTQTMERKSSVADHEVNELTNKNEDLTQQLQSLQEQLDDSERRREQEREESTREKDQWLQMLEQGRRLQAKILQEKKALSDRIAALQAENDVVRSSSDSLTTDGEAGDAERPVPIDGVSTARSEDVAILKADIEMLRSSLEEAKSHRQQLDERAYQVLRQSSDIGNVIDRALGVRSAEEEAQQSPKLVRDTLDSSSPQRGSAPSPPRSVVDGHSENEQLNLGSFRPLTTYDTPMQAASVKQDEPRQGVDSTTMPSLSITVTESASKAQALLAAASGLPTPITPLSAMDQQNSYTPVGNVSRPSPFEHAATTPSSTTMPPPPRPVA